MKQLGTVEITFTGTKDPFVAVTITTVISRIAFLLDEDEARELREELDAAMLTFETNKRNR